MRLLAHGQTVDTGVADTRTGRDGFWHVAHGTTLIPELLMLEQVGTASGMWHTGHTRPTVDIRVADAGTSQDSFWHGAHGTHKVDTGVADAGTGRDSFWHVAHGAH